MPDAYTECNRQTPAIYYDYYLVVCKVRVTCSLQVRVMLFTLSDLAVTSIYIVPVTLKSSGTCFSHIQDSNQLHATCLDTFPPIHYLSATSHKVIQLATKYNELHGQIKVMTCN